MSTTHKIRETDFCGQSSLPSKLRTAHLLCTAMRHLLAACLFISAKLFYALPTGRSIGSDHHGAPPTHASNGELLAKDPQKQWHFAPSFNDRSALRMAAPVHTDEGHSAASTLVSDQRATGQAGWHRAVFLPPRHHSVEQVVSKSGESSTHTGSSWSPSDLQLVSQLLWDSSPPSSQHPPQQMVDSEHAHFGQRGSIALEPESKRLKKHHAVTSQPHHHAFTPGVSESHVPTMHGGSSWSPSSNYLSTHEQESVSIHGNAPRTKNPPTKLKPLQLPIGLTVTAEAHPQEVHTALRAVHDRYTPGGSTQARHRTSILEMAVASVADGCTSEVQYSASMKNKYGEGLVETHRVPLRRIIRKDMAKKAGVGTKVKTVKRIVPLTADHNGRWFAEDSRVEKLYAKLELPPVDRIEPPIRPGDVRKYQGLIKHHNPFQLRPDQYIKHAFLPLEQQPHRWNKRIPRMAMKEDLRNKGAGQAMVAHLEQIYDPTMRSVSDCLGWLTVLQMALTQGNQNRKRQHREKSLQTLATSSSHRRKSSKPRAAPFSPPEPH